MLLGTCISLELRRILLDLPLELGGAVHRKRIVPGAASDLAANGGSAAIAAASTAVRDAVWPGASVTVKWRESVDVRGKWQVRSRQE